jgi:hypothetical protein
MMACCYWAKFRIIKETCLRFDTRIYLEAVMGLKVADPCIGAVVGKNPGSAMPFDADRKAVRPDEYEATMLSNDRLLPTVRSIVSKAYCEANKSLPPRAYVQVLNLLYVRDSDLEAAIEAAGRVKGIHRCLTEQHSFAWVWYVWGGPSRRLDPSKKRFEQVQTDTPFFFDPRASKVQKRVPRAWDFARHTQGLVHEPIVSFLAKHL